MLNFLCVATLSLSLSLFLHDNNMEKNGCRFFCNNCKKSFTNEYTYTRHVESEICFRSIECRRELYRQWRQSQRQQQQQQQLFHSTLYYGAGNSNRTRTRVNNMRKRGKRGRGRGRGRGRDQGRARTLRKQINRHTCQDCGQNLSSRYALNRHRQRFHLNVRIHFPCGLCNKLFANGIELDRHRSEKHSRTNDEFYLRNHALKKSCQV